MSGSPPLQRIHTLIGLLLLLMASQSARAAAERRASGREIYRQQCAKCHGRTGEGVKRKYGESLQGDWSFERLTRYIDKNMPEDAPEKCVGPDADAVARFIYEGFYSREARLRKHPPRIELVRLTNRQYVNAIADLIQQFTGSDPPVAGDRGLRAVYYGARNFRGDTKNQERVDRQLNFDFGEGRPELQPTGTNGFSMQWRGALIADETGDYEFILKTPNGARLWLNDDDTPLIDAGVASGQLNEHKATLRLLGSRAYSLRLDFFKF